MKRIKKSPEESFRPCVLYREDIEHLVNAISDGNPEEVGILVGDDRAENLEDLFKFLGSKGRSQLSLGELLRGVSVSTYEGGTVVVRSSGDNVLNDGRFIEAVDIIKSTKIRSKFNILFFFGIAFVILAGICVGNAARASSSLSTVLYFIASLFSLVCSILLNRTANKTETRFFGIRRDEQESFMKRNSDKLIVGFTIALVTAVLSVAGTLLTQHFLAKPGS